MREGTAKEIAKWHGISVSNLRKFVEENYEELKAFKANEEEIERVVKTFDQSEPTPTQLEDLWITNKFERLKRLQQLADKQYGECMSGRLMGAELATGLREFRSYLALAANELGQLLHRGSGDSATDEQLAVDMVGVDMEKLR